MTTMARLRSNWASEKRQFKWPLTLLAPDRLSNWDTAGIFPHNHYRESSKKKEKQRKYPVSSNSDGGQTRTLQADRKVTVTQVTSCYSKGPQDSTSDLEVDTAAQAGCHCCRLRTGNRGYSSHVLTKHQHFRKAVWSDEPWLLLLRSECGETDMKAQIHPAGA